MAQPVAHSLRNKWRSSDIKLDTKYTFSMLVKNRKILAGLKSAGFRRPSPVQVLAVSPARTGRALEHIISRDPDLQVLIITPTREIAIQVQQVVLSIGKYFQNFNCEAFIGGLPTYEDVAKLRNCQIAVGTPGRLRHLIDSEYMNTQSVELLILDEADHLLESSFLKDLKCIISHLPKNRQIMAVSATYKDNIISTFLDYMHNAKVIRVYDDELALKGVVQFFHVLKSNDHEETYKRKFRMMLNILNSISFAQCMVFSISMTEVLLLCRDLRKHGHAVASISSQDQQERRLQTIAEFKECKIKILVTTDLTARGIDAANVDLVFNMDPAFDMETYVHRVGRAGRYGSRGISITLVTRGSEVQTLLWYKVKGNFPVYPLPDPIPHDLKKYIPSSPELANALLEYEVKRNCKTDKLVTKESEDRTDRILSLATEDLDNRKEGNDEQDSVKSPTNSSSEHDAVGDTPLTRVQITNSSSENSKTSMNGNKLPEGDALKIEEAVIEDNSTVQQHFSMGRSDIELVMVDEWPSPSSSDSKQVYSDDHNDHIYCEVLKGDDTKQYVVERTMNSNKCLADVIKSAKPNSSTAAEEDKQKLDGAGTLEEDLETGNHIIKMAEVSLPDQQNGVNSCIEDGAVVCDNEGSKSGTEYEIFNLSLSRDYEEKDVYFDNLESCREEVVQEAENETNVTIKPVEFFFEAGGGDFSSDAFFFDSSVQPVEEKNLIEPVLDCSLNSGTERTVDDLEKDNLTNGDATSSNTLNAPSILASENSNHIIYNSDLEHINLSIIENDESQVLDTKEIDMQILASISKKKVKGTNSHAGVKKTKICTETPVENETKKKNKINKMPQKPKQWNYINVDSDLQGYMQLRSRSIDLENKKNQEIRKSGRREISDVANQSLKTDEKENTCRDSSLRELFEERNRLKFEAKKEFSTGAIPKQREKFDRKINDRSEVNKSLVNKRHGSNKHREMDHQSRDSHFSTSESHKEKKFTTSFSKVHKRADHHHINNDFHDDYESDNHCNLRCNHQKITSFISLGHAHKAKDICGHCSSKCGGNSHSSQVQNLDCMPRKCCGFYNSSATQTRRQDHQCYHNRCACCESIPMPFPPFYHPHNKDFDYGSILHKALLLSLSQY